MNKSVESLNVRARKTNEIAFKVQHKAVHWIKVSETI